MTTMTDRRRASRARYEARRRVRLRAQGKCPQCGKARRQGVSKTGWRLSRCGRCITKMARLQCRWQYSRLRAGLCVSCPRKKPRGDQHWECPQCRQIRNTKRKAGQRQAA